VEFIDSLCRAAVQQGASDLYLHSGRVPQVRIDNQLLEFGDQAISEEEIESLWAYCGALPGTLDLDGSFVASDGQRYRVNLFRTLFLRGAVLRPIKTLIPALDTLGVPVDLLSRPPWQAASNGLTRPITVTS
jgi:Tfp pilus assembly pilus retraction ATPase PilT